MRTSSFFTKSLPAEKECAKFNLGVKRLMKR